MTTKNMFEDEDFYDSAYSDRRRPWLSEAYKFLADGEWHDREEVIKELAKTVPPGIAWRHAEEARINQIKRNARLNLSGEDYEEYIKNPENLERSSPVDEDTRSEIIRGGQRGLVLSSLLSSQRIETRREGKKVFVRRIPMSDRFVNSNANRLRRFQAGR